MVQTRNMIKNNITIEEIQTRKYHMMNYENTKELTISYCKGIINHIFNSFREERNITSNPKDITLVDLTIFRYEMKLIYLKTHSNININV